MLGSHSKQTVNFIIYGESESDASSIAKTIIGAEENGVFTSIHDNYEIRGYLRWPRGGRSVPLGFTEVLVVHSSSSTGDNSDAENYIEQRNYIPIKIILSSDQEFKSWEASKKMIFVSDAGALQAHLISELKKQDEKIKELFTQNQNEEGDLSITGLLMIAQQIGHTGEVSERNVHHKPMPLQKFRKWYLFGRHDDALWSSYLDFEFSPKLVEKVTAFRSVLENFQSEVSNEVSYTGKLNISPLTQFTEGLKFGYEFKSGDEFTSICNALPYSISHAPLTISLEIGIKDPSSFAASVETLNQIKEMAKMIPQVQSFYKSGIDVHFRNTENRLFADVIFAGMVADVLTTDFKGVNLDVIKYSGLGSVSFATGLSPLFIQDKDIEEVLNAALNFQVSGNGQVINMKVLVKLITLVIDALKNKNLRGLDTLITNFLKVIKIIGFDLKYDAAILLNTVKEFINNFSNGLGYNQLRDQYVGLQMMFQGILQQGQQMVMFIQEFLGLVKNIDLDNISLNFTSPLIRSFFQIYLHLPGLTAFLNENFLNQ